MRSNGNKERGSREKKEAR
ncbi:hypothetical protein BM10_54 [Bacillus phage BM15]|uniref:Uncharacterized protein n=1 Tax=Bacillus phage BM15 TaxID=1755680 RepID=A0A0S2MUB1_9CAUD|nr:hypothetical protein FD732_gp054 [Bacillus phage BM15]ALO79475.1 hypothetical protein BM10_54 [Bacillus phage BM15]